MADTSSYPIEERLVASVWVHERQHTGQTMSQLMAAFRERFNPLNAKLNPICHLLALLGAHHIIHVSGLRVKVIRLHHEERHCWIGKNERSLLEGLKTGRGVGERQRVWKHVQRLPLPLNVPQ